MIHYTKDIIDMDNDVKLDIKKMAKDSKKHINKINKIYTKFISKLSIKDIIFTGLLSVGISRYFDKLNNKTNPRQLL